MATEKIPLVSVIIPMFNAAKFIPHTLESLLYQTMQDFEVIVVDDGSTANSIEVAESFKEKFGERLRVIKLPKNSGMPGLPRNVGIQIAYGKYIAFLDADDLFTKTALEELSSLAENYQADVVHLKDSYRLFKGEKISVDDPRMTDFNFLTTPENFTFTEWRYPIFPRPEPLAEPALESEYLAPRLQAWIRWNYRLNVCANFCRREFLISNQIFFPEMPAAEAHIFNFACLCLAKNFLCAPNVVYIVRPKIDLTARDGDKVQEVEKYFRKWLNVLNGGFNELEKFMDQFGFFKEQLNYRYSVLGFFFRCIIDTEIVRKYPADYSPLIYQIAKKGFKPDNAAFSSYLFNIFNIQRLQIAQLQAINDELKNTPKISPKKNPLVSVIIPMFNSEKFISQTLESLLYQTMTDFEVIIVDDCSTDNGVEVAKSFAEKFADLGAKLTVINLPKNTGTPGLPRNVGIQSARGKYIAFLDSDDLFTKTALEELSTLAEKYSSDVVKLQSNFILWEGKRRLIDDPLMTNFEELTNPENFTQVSRSEEPLKEPAWDSEDIGERVKKWFSSPPDEFWSNCLSFWRRDLLVENKISFSEMPTCEDAPFTFEAFCLAKKILHAPNCVYIVRSRENSISRDRRNVTLEYHLHKRISAMRIGFEEFERIMSKIPFFADHPDYRYSMLAWFTDYRLSLMKNNTYKNYPLQEVNDLVKREFESYADANFAAYLFDAVNLYLLEIDELENKIKALEGAKETQAEN